MGWIVADDQPWAGGPALTHAGSNTMWLAVAWLAPNKDLAILVACNQDHHQACNDATCLPPKTFKLTGKVPVARPGEQVKPANQAYFPKPAATPR